MIGTTDYLKVKRTESSVNIGEDRYHYLYDPLGLYSQVMKCTWWMPWQSEAMKDVIACDKLRGGGKYPVIRRFLNGETRLAIGIGS